MPIDGEFRNLDFSKYSYEEFEQFFFARPVLNAHKGRTFETEFCPDIDTFESSQPERTVSLLEKLFTEFNKIGSKYTLKQINQGIWALLGPQIQIQDSLWDERVRIEKRIRCIWSMFVPYRDFVCGHPIDVMENCFYMWWDMVAGSFRIRLDYGGELMTENDRSILDAMFFALCDILALNDDRCQQSALHGLGHVGHPQVFETVRKFIDNHRSSFTHESLVWAERCRDGTVM